MISARIHYPSVVMQLSAKMAVFRKECTASDLGALAGINKTFIKNDRRSKISVWAKTFERSHHRVNFALHLHR